MKLSNFLQFLLHLIIPVRIPENNLKDKQSKIKIKSTMIKSNTNDTKKKKKHNKKYLKNSEKT